MRLDKRQLRGKKIIWAVKSQHSQQLEESLEDSGDQVNYKDDAGRTALIWATVQGDVAATQLLLATEEIDPNVPESETGRTALSLAVGERQEDIVTLLLNHHKTDPNVGDTFSRTPLLWASLLKQPTLVKLLLDRKEGNVDVNAQDSDGQSPLSWAIMNRDETTLKLLLSENSISLELPTCGGRLPLLETRFIPSQGVVQIWLAHEPDDPALKGNDGRTAVVEVTMGEGGDTLVNLLEKP